MDNARVAKPEESFAIPTGPKGQKRPADVIGNTVKVMHNTTGDRSYYHAGLFPL
jgi:hypothetical protein